MPSISIQATDTLFFRDGRPFSMGDDSFAQGIFPPPPSVLYGALRSLFIANGLENGEELNDLIASSESLQIQFMAFDDGNGSHYLPLPKDLIVPNQGKDLKAIPLQLVDKPLYSNSISPKTLKSSYDGKTSDEPHLIGLTSLESYLDGYQENIPFQKISDFITTESKIGIGRDKESNIADGGKLFRIQANRMAKTNGKHTNKFYFLLDYESLSLPSSGWINFGGERRVAAFKTAKIFKIPCPEIGSPQFKIYLSTPAVFEGGWKPENLLKEHGLTLLAAALDRPLNVGGWDLNLQRPKPMVQCVPAGSVYYVEAANEEEAKIAAAAIHGQSISENLNQTDYRAMGFGIAYVGKI